MPSISGSFSAHVTAETTLFPDDQPNHQLQIAEIHATQKSPDPNWNNSQLIYHGVTDLVAGIGTQHGYYVNEHADGDRDCGTCAWPARASGTTNRAKSNATRWASIAERPAKFPLPVVNRSGFWLGGTTGMPTNKLWLEQTERAAWESVEALREKLLAADKRIERLAPPVSGWAELLRALDAAREEHAFELE